MRKIHLWTARFIIYIAMPALLLFVSYGVATSVAGTIGGYNSGKLAKEKAVAQDLRAFSQSRKIYTAAELNPLLKDLARLLTATHSRQMRELIDDNTRYNVSPKDRADIDEIIDRNRSDALTP